jgi:hypothetical protein
MGVVYVLSRRRISTLVSRDYGFAKRMVANVGKGIFP